MKNKPMLGKYELEGIEYVEALESRALVEHRVPAWQGTIFRIWAVSPMPSSSRVAVSGMMLAMIPEKRSRHVQQS